ncbi:hypothetical protein Tco_0803211 [Tanacetum coccineum]|uniref:Uncharacterized protein n=1 Tax=Tanacetum coccineum TaxID=301880 RepID=A0ABQ5A5A8_9ASTR
MVSPSIVTISNVVAPNVVKTNDGFQTVVTKKKKKKGKSKASNGGQFDVLRYKNKMLDMSQRDYKPPKKGATIRRYDGWGKNKMCMMKWLTYLLIHKLVEVLLSRLLLVSLRPSVLSMNGGYPDISQATKSSPKKGATNVGNSSKSSSTLKTTRTPSKNDNIITSNSYSALNDEEEDVENVYDESANLFQNTKTGGSSTFTVAAG